MPKLLWVMCLAVSLPAFAQDSRGERPFDWEQYRRDAAFSNIVYTRARAIQPRRRDAPLRELNITDEEVREIQKVTRSYLPDAYVNISPVVTGCPCEEGPACKDQVYILADAGTATLGLQLSRIQDAWKVGEVQKWWLSYTRLLAKRDTMDFFDYQSAELKLAREFPVCASGDDSKATTASRKSETPR